MNILNSFFLLGGLSFLSLGLLGIDLRNEIELSSGTLWGALTSGGGNIHGLYYVYGISFMWLWLGLLWFYMVIFCRDDIIITLKYMFKYIFLLLICMILSTTYNFIDVAFSLFTLLMGVFHVYKLIILNER